jgi:simple sugar transport system permease protein
MTAVGVERDRHARWAAPRQAGVAGIIFGVGAFWLALPPLVARAPQWPVGAGIVAVACGIWSASRGERRLGIGAAVTGGLGIFLGLLAMQASEQHLHDVVQWAPLLSLMLVWATPLTFAALGGMFSERSGVVNIGLEGMMLAGAFFGILGADKLDSWALGLLCAMASGAILALIHAVLSIHLRSDQIVSGTAINFLALGVTGYFFIQVYGTNGIHDLRPESEIPDVHLGFLGNGFIGDVFGDLNLMIWLSFALIVGSYVFMFKTPPGLRVRSVGEHPRAADTVGIPVYLVRYLSVVTSGAIVALGGAYLSAGFSHSFGENMTAGRGFIGLAALIFGNWRPFGAFAAALLFGFSTALQFRLAAVWGNTAVLFGALPYLLTLIAVAGVIGKTTPPASLGRPYRKQ